ncbi:MAG TPA: hypothetical protein VGO58_00735 [Chitinophagaceae bacterium]|nr:hypothetical protein [Chitinophagaceae bacterium]
MIAVMASVVACSRGGDDVSSGGGGGPHVFVPSDTTAPEIIIFTPADNQVFSNGNNISITGRVTDDYGLYRGTIRIVNDANGFMLVNQPYEIHGILLYNFNISHTTSVSTVSNYTVTVSFEDHGLNSTTRSVKVKVNP